MAHQKNPAGKGVAGFLYLWDYWYAHLERNFFLVSLSIIWESSGLILPFPATHLPQTNTSSKLSDFDATTGGVDFFLENYSAVIIPAVEATLVDLNAWLVL